jgi:hypothetical protein
VRRFTAVYAANLDNVKTTGDFTVVLQKDCTLIQQYQKFNIDIASNNASVQYPNLPKSIQNIIIDSKII